MSNLEKMTGHTRLYRRNATYYHRATVPKDIAKTYGKKEETFSLGTKDRAEALSLVRVKAVEVDERFDAHRKRLAQSNEPYLDELTEEQIKLFGEIYYTYILEEDEDERLRGFDEFQDIDGERIWISERQYLPRDTFEEQSDTIEEMLEYARYHLARGKVDDFVKEETKEVLEWDGLELKLAEGSPSWSLLHREMYRSIVRAHEARLSRNEGNIVDTLKVDSVTQVEALTASKYPNLSEAVDQWVKDVEHGWSDKTKRSNLSWVNNFLEVCGDKHLDQYSKADGRLFKETFSRLPPSWRIRKELKHLDIHKASARASELQLEPMSFENINKGIGKVSLFWNWVDAHYFDDNAPQPLRGLKYNIRSNPREARDPFSNEQLEKIFNAPVFTGCLSETHWSRSGTQLIKGSPKFWIPLLGLFSGGRLSELCQLEIDDIKEADKVPYLDINGKLANERNVGDKGIKSPNAQRKIPIHPTLIDIGFLKFVREMKQSGETRLFPSIKIGADGSYSDHFSKHFSRFLKLCDAKTAKTNFHSFRHNFEDACGNAQLHIDTKDAITGRSSTGMRARYGSRDIQLKTLQEAIHAIEYEGLNLRHLF
ncbi:integrase [Amylibacter ulvae]|uniref:Integrase n=1 Tax=Paramylibacter ulvae TaxID=1651968 RepID=A0ABQ3DCI8_9RHOB|nr:site-specific integrase [Amylibacter ulvae]GHA61048.1 integrase [Amylibacter ulvae]